MTLFSGSIRALIATLISAAAGLSMAAGSRSLDGAGSDIVRHDHFVNAKSSAPAMAGQHSSLFVREAVRLDVLAQGRVPGSDSVVVFVHGAGTPGSVSFDLQHADYSWMAYLARAGFDTFAVDLTGYGASTRPYQMNDRCNASPADQKRFPAGPKAGTACLASIAGAITNIGSDWDDIDAVVDYVRKIRGVDKVSLVGWSLGGLRTVGYAARHPDKVLKLVELAPFYERNGAAMPQGLDAGVAALALSSREDYLGAWSKQVACPNQVEPGVSDAVWRAMQDTDPVGATWGPGLRRAPALARGGLDKEGASKVVVPALVVHGANDSLVPQARGRELFEDLGGEQKVFVDLGCASHMAMWEKNRHILFEASREFLRGGSVRGERNGILKLGY